MTERIDHTGTHWVCTRHRDSWDVEVGQYISELDAYLWVGENPFTRYISQEALDTGAGNFGTRFMPMNNMEKLEELFS